MPGKRKEAPVADKEDLKQARAARKKPPDASDVKLLLGEGASNVPYDALKPTLRAALERLRADKHVAKLVAELEKGSSEETLVETLVDRLIEHPFSCAWQSMLRSRRTFAAANALIEKVKGVDPEGAELMPEAMIEHAEAVRALVPGRKGDSLLSAAEFFKERGGEFSSEAQAKASDLELWGSELQTKVLGMGPATMLLVLLKVYARLDVLPKTDPLVANFLAAQTTLADEQAAMCEAWRPHRGVVALLVWLANEHAAEAHQEEAARPRSLSQPA